MAQTKLDLPETLKTVRLKCLKVVQPLGTFYIGVMRWRDLCDIADFDVRRVIDVERDVERYLGIQRQLDEKRAAQLARYVQTVDATFPTSIVLAVPADCAFEEEDGRILVLQNKPAPVQANEFTSDPQSPVLFRNIARILDGQHRIKGMMDGLTGDTVFDVPVTIFVDVDVAEQAQIFATVNLEQTKVSKSLAYDLFSLAKSRSPIKTCHNIAMALDQNSQSPFYKRIKRLGTSTKGRFNETISQHQFIEALMPQISSDARADRDVLLRGGRLPKVDAETSRRLVFRNLFIDEKDLDIAEIVFNYFSAAKERWPHAWNEFGEGYMLAKTNGFRALMRFLRPAYLYKGFPGEVVSKSRFLEVFERVDLSDKDFTVEKFKPGTSGESDLARILLSAIK
jgi:DGQHR domain-containing protein